MIQSGEASTATTEEEEEEEREEELRQSRFPLHLPRPRLGLEGGAPLSVVPAAAMSSRGAEPAKEEEEWEVVLSHIQGL